MLEVIGAVVATLATLYFVGACLYLPLMSAAFGGFKQNLIGIIVGIIFSAAFCAGWWFVVGVHIHVSFG